jgi:hypothetical protein
MRQLTTLLLALMMAAGAAQAQEDCPRAIFPPEAGERYLLAQAALLSGDFAAALTLSTSLSDADPGYCELLKVRRLMVLAFQQSMASPGISARLDATQAVARLEEEEKGTQRYDHRAARFAVIALQMQGAVSEAEKVGDEAGLEWPVLHPVRPLPDSASRRLKPAWPLEVR